MLLRKILSSSGNPSKVFMYLELGILPVKIVLMKKTLNFMRYILHEGMSSLIRQVYETLKTESRYGDFVDLVKKDIEELNLNILEPDIQNTIKMDWKKYVNEKVSEACLLALNAENSSKTKTKHIIFKNLEMREYL